MDSNAPTITASEPKQEIATSLLASDIGMVLYNIEAAKFLLKPSEHSRGAIQDYQGLIFTLDCPKKTIYEFRTLLQQRFISTHVNRAEPEFFIHYANESRHVSSSQTALWPMQPIHLKAGQSTSREADQVTIHHSDSDGRYSCLPAAKDLPTIAQGTPHRRAPDDIA